MYRTLPRRPLRAVSACLAGLAALVLGSCADEPTPAQTDVLDLELPTSADVLSLEETATDFAFLPPLRWNLPREKVVQGLEPDVVICDVTEPGSPECSDPIPAFQRFNHYQVNWFTRWWWVNRRYTIDVRLDGVVLGSAEVVLDRRSREFAGLPYPIRFWIGEDLGQFAGTLEPGLVACLDEDRCNADVVEPGETTVIETVDEGGNTMAVLTFDPEDAPEPLTVALDCRDDGFAPGVGPLPTDLDQWPLFCRVDVTTATGPFTGALDEPALLEVCVIDEALEVNYHDFTDHSDLLLGKSSGGSDFEFLPFAPTPSLPNCVGRTLTAIDPGGALEQLGDRIGDVLGWLGPGELHAAWFRDGGVGGLIRSFSDINPVAPAYVEGSVVGDGTGPLVGVELALSGGLLVGPVTATSGPDGTFAFDDPLQAAEGGGTVYTVSVDPTTLPPGELLADATQQVAVTGSGVFEADFLTSSELELVGFGGTWDYEVPGDVPVTGSGPGPFYTTEGYPHGPCTLLNEQIVENGQGTGVWPRQGLITLTRSVDVPVGATHLEILAWIDNDVRVEIDGVDVTAEGSGGTYEGPGGFRRHENCANLDPLSFSIPTTFFTPGEEATLTFFVRDRGTIGYADFRITAVATVP